MGLNLRPCACQAWSTTELWPSLGRGGGRCPKIMEEREGGWDVPRSDKIVAHYMQLSVRCLSPLVDHSFCMNVIDSIMSCGTELDEPIGYWVMKGLAFICLELPFEQFHWVTGVLVFSEQENKWKTLCLVCLPPGHNSIIVFSLSAVLFLPQLKYCTK